jgi:predicted MFS family arabinose efflux permease
LDVGAELSRARDAAAPAALGEGAWRGLILLTLIFTINSLDRSAMIVVIEPIKHEFHLKDSQLGLLTGLAFGATYAVFAIPLGTLADRLNRRNLLAGLLAVWSLATAACGLARNFAMLLAARMVVGAAESGASPASNSMISDLFPPNRRATAVAIFFLGPPLGAMIAFKVGSAVATAFGWRMTFLLAGLPGLVLAALLLLIMRHPPRGTTDSAAQAVGAGTVLGGLRNLFANPVLTCVFIAITISTLVTTSFQAWYASLLIREHGFTLKEAGTAMAFGASLFGGIGVACSGRIADWVSKGEARGLLLFTATTLSLTLVSSLVAVASPVTPVAMAALCAFGFFSLAHLGPSFAVLLNTTPNRDRGVVVAALQISANFLGAGLGPWAAGGLSDHFGGPNALSQALLVVMPTLAISVALFLAAWRMARTQQA